MVFLRLAAAYFLEFWFSSATEQQVMTKIELCSTHVAKTVSQLTSSIINGIISSHCTEQRSRPFIWWLALSEL